MNETIYEDETITVTPTEIRAKGFVLYIENISSISVTTVRPWKWAAPFLVVPIVMLMAAAVFLNRMLGPLLRRGASAVSFSIFLAVLPICVIVILGFFFRISRLFLQTTGGPVVLAWSFSLSEPYGTLAKYNSIKEAIETAMALQKKN